MNDQNPMQRKLLFDHPSADDEFSGGGHRRTAKSLASTILEFGNRVRSIGLEGKWGSGKSTIVGIAKKFLDEADNGRKYHVFTFDLWTNQNTPFRRSFLESLLSWLEGTDGADLHFIERMRDRIGGRTVETRTENTKVFSVFGLCALVFLLSLPLLYAWLSPVALNNANGIPGYSYVAMLAVLAMLAVTVYLALKAYRDSRTPSGSRRLPLTKAFSQTISVFSKDSQTVDIKQSIREADPTQNEFQRTLKDILASFQTEDRRIIIVFDNIDRLQSDKIVEAWSDIRAVLSASRDNDGDGEKLTAIVPYDRQHVLRAMKSDDPDPALRHEDVFRKSFDAIFFVAPPVLSDAADFFGVKLCEAFCTEFSNNLTYRIYKIFDLSNSPDTATPRQVIAFINAIAALWEQWNPQINLPTIAVYVAKKDDIDKDPAILRREDGIEIRYRELAEDPQLIRNLAALTFNIDPEHAFQVLLHGRIEQAFTADEDGTFEEVRSSPGFALMLPDVFRDFSQSWADSSLTQFKQAVRRLATLDKGAASTQECKVQLIDALEKLRPAPFNEWEKTHDLLALHHLCNKAESARVTSTLAGWLARSLPEKESERTFEHGQHWRAFVAAMYAAVEGQHGPDEAKRSFEDIEFPTGFEFLIGTACGKDATDLHISGLKRAGRGEGSLQAFMDEALLDSPGRFLHAWPEIRHLVGDDAIPGYIEKLASHLTAHQYSGEPRKLSFYIQSLNMLYEDSDKKDLSLKSRRALVSNGALYYDLYQLRDSMEEDAIQTRSGALWMILDHFRAKPVAAVSLHQHAFGNLDEAQTYAIDLVSGGAVDDATLDALVEMTVRYDRLSHWITAAAGSSQSELLRRVIAATVAGGDYPVPPPKTIMAHYDFIAGLLADNADALLAEVGNKRKPEDFAIVDLATLPLDLVAAAARRTEPGWQRFLSKLDTQLAAQDASTWREALGANGSLLGLLRQRVRDAGVKLHPEALRDPITEHFLETISGAVSAPSDLDDIVNALPPSNQHGLAEDLLERLERTSVTPAGFDNALASYAGLLEKLPFTQRPDTTVRKIVMPAIRSGSDVSVGFLDTHKEAFKSALNVSKSRIEEILEFLDTPAQDEDEASAAAKRRIRDILGLPPPKQPDMSESPPEDVAENLNKAAEDGVEKQQDSS